MSRKDYVRVADILASVRNEMDRELFNHIVTEFNDFFFEDNHNFSPVRFENACHKETTLV